MFNLGKIFHNSEAKKLKTSLLSSTRALFSGKARCFSESERTLYGNFIGKYIALYLSTDTNSRQFLTHQTLIKDLPSS